MLNECKDPSFLHAGSKDSDQTGHAQADFSLHWAYMTVGFVMHRLKYKMVKWFALPTAGHVVPGLNPTGCVIQLMTVYIASLCFSITFTLSQFDNV